MSGKDFEIVERKNIEELIKDLDFLQTSILSEVKSILTLSNQNVDFSKELKAIQTRMAELIDKIGAKEDNVHQILKDLQSVSQQELIDSFKKDIELQKREFSKIIKSTELEIFKLQEEFQEEFFGNKKNSNRLYSVMLEATNAAFSKLTHNFNMYENDTIRIERNLKNIEKELDLKNNIFFDLKQEFTTLKSAEYEKKIVEKVKKEHFLNNIFKITIPAIIISSGIVFITIKTGILGISMIENENYYHIDKKNWVKTENENNKIYKIIENK